jgi:hypothetical protein
MIIEFRGLPKLFLFLKNYKITADFWEISEGIEKYAEARSLGYN